MAQSPMFAVPRKDIVRDAMIAALLWPVIGMVTLACDGVISSFLGVDPFSDGIIFGLAGWFEWALLAPIVVVGTVAIRSGFPSRWRFLLAHGVVALLTSLAHSTMYFALRTVVYGVPGGAHESFIEAWVSRMDAHLQLDFLVYALTASAIHAAISLRRLAEEERVRLELQRRIARTELELLRFQLPHELLSLMLRRIESATRTTDPMSAEVLTVRLSRLLRSALTLTRSDRSLDDELSLARNFAAAAAVVREQPFTVQSSAANEIGNDIAATKLMLPILVSVWKDARPEERPVITIAASCVDDRARVVWTITGARQLPRLRTFVEEAALRLSAAESIDCQEEGERLLITWRRATRVPEEESGAIPADSSPASAPRPPRLARWVWLLALYPPVEAALVSLLTLVSAAVQHRTPAMGFLRPVWPAAMATPLGIGLAWLAYRQRHRAQHYGTIAVFGLIALIGPMISMTMASAFLALFRPMNHGFAEILRCQVVASYRTTDFLIFFGIAVGVLAYGRQFATEERRFGNWLLDEQLARTHAQVLKGQLNPHFLFNALNSILALLDGDRAAARAMTARLRDYLKRVMAMAARQQVPLREELDLALAYLDIEKVRFRERLSISFDVAPAVLDALVPNLLLQPLLENAVRHGLAPIQGGTVQIKAAAQREELFITVRDNGRGARGAPWQDGIGMQNVRSRLRQLHGAAFTIEVENTIDGYAVTIRMPLRVKAGVPKARVVEEGRLAMISDPA